MMWWVNYLIEESLIPAVLVLYASCDLLEQCHSSFGRTDIEEARIETEDPHRMCIPCPAHGWVISYIVISCIDKQFFIIKLCQ